VVSFVAAAILSASKEDRSDLIVPILFLSLFLPLQILGYYKYRQFLSKKGIKTGDQINKKLNDVETHKFLAEKGVVAAIFALSAFFTWGVLKLFNKVFDN